VLRSTVAEKDPADTFGTCPCSYIKNLLVRRKKVADHAEYLLNQFIGLSFLEVFIEGSVYT
jgi:hypothetical protein